MSTVTTLKTKGGQDVLVEVDATGPSNSQSIRRVGARELIQPVLDGSKAILEDVLSTAMQINTEALFSAIAGLSQAPKEVKISFGLKFSGEANAFFLTKATGEAHYEISLTFQPQARLP